MIIRLPECPEYDHFTKIMSEKYDTVIAHDTDDMIEMVMGPREHLASFFKFAHVSRNKSWTLPS